MPKKDDEDERWFRPSAGTETGTGREASRYRLKPESTTRSRDREEAVSEMVTKEDFRELARELREGQEGIREEIRGLGTQLSTHALEDATREGKTAAELSTVRAKLESLSDSSDDRHRFMRGWLGGLLTVAIAAGIGFLFRSAIAVQTSSPPQSPPAAPAARIASPGEK